MGFYEEFAEKYDSLVSFENRMKRESGFYKKLFARHKVVKILDCACGTGQHVIMFNKMGFEAKGSDLSPAMVRIARKNAKKRGVAADFRIADFRKLRKAFRGEFDAVVCEGNSLPHLFRDADLLQALREMRAVLRKGGLLMLQQRNYDMLLKKKKRFFPVSIRKDEVFFYALDYLPGKITFNVIDVETGTGKFNVYSSDYNPLKKGRLAALLRKAGFKSIAFYGDYNSSKFDVENDWSLLAVCKK